MFDKFPKIPNQQKNELETGSYTVQEKLDGANAGLQLVEYNGTWAIVVHSRSQLLAQVFMDSSGPIVELHKIQLGAFHDLVEQVKENVVPIIRYMRDRGYKHIYGEWLVKHTIDYPADMWNTFYPFDAINKSGQFITVNATEEDYPQVFGRVISMSVFMDGSTPQSKFIRNTTTLIQTGVARRIEGTVWKRYDLDYEAKLDQYGQRFCYKDVLPEFREDHRNNPDFPAPLEPLDKTSRVAAHLPEHSLEKVYQKLVVSNGSWDNKLIGPFINAVWQEFMEEHIIGALRAEKMPKLDTDQLFKIIAKRAREFALEHVAT